MAVPRLRSSNISTFIGIVLLLFIFYILFLPPAEREALLAEEPTGLGPTTGRANLSEGILFEAKSVSMDVLKEEEREHRLPSLVLKETREPKTILKMLPFDIKKGWFTTKIKDVPFFIDNIDDVEEVQLKFQAPVKKGLLRITINGYVLFDSRVDIPPLVPIPKQILRKNNIITFEAGGGFFEKKQFTLTDVHIIAQVKNIARSMAHHTFSIGEQEYNRLRESTINFYAACDQSRVGVLEITLNNNLVSKALPACDSPNVYDVFKEDLRPGKNTMTIFLSKGTIELQQLRLKTGAEEIKPLIGYFYIDRPLMADIIDQVTRIIFTIEFVETEHKQAELSVNGILYAIDQKDRTYEIDISPDIKFGNNYISLEPLTSLDIVSARVWMED